MSVKVLILMILLSASVESFAMLDNDEGKLVLEVTGLRNERGFVLASLFDSPSGFPGSGEKAMRKEKAKIQNGKAVIVFDKLPKGTYAIAVLHDENENLKMDTKALVLPNEGYGFSQDAMGTFGPPKFKQASFIHEGEQNLTIKIRY